MPIEVKTPEDFSGAIGEKQPATVQFLGAAFLKVSTEELESVCKEIDVDCFPTFRVCKDGEMTSAILALIGMASMASMAFANVYVSVDRCCVLLIATRSVKTYSDLGK
ncbi:putative thioredoxin [Phytophthora cinnamomi]|uniref:putative thioredoxin n=1 Tax=Phytophthora cinnamomi TaxID=4785 RepID=UPI003559F177|nr:putative thioredoxin [Phytophthora cinnamomi]